MHAAAYQFVCEMLAYYGQPSSVVEIGSYNVNGSVRPLFVKAIALDQYVGIDTREGPGVDVVCDGAKYRATKQRFPEGVEFVICCEVLEHARNARALVLNACRMLNAGGLLVLTCATDPRAAHPCGPTFNGPEYYRNVDPEDAKKWLEQAKLTSYAVRVQPALGDLYAWGSK